MAPTSSELSDRRPCMPRLDDGRVIVHDVAALFAVCFIAVSRPIARWSIDARDRRDPPGWPPFSRACDVTFRFQIFSRFERLTEAVSSNSPSAELHLTTNHRFDTVLVSHDLTEAQLRL
jgi:hypothetical protein